jgi:hypothetical protein
MLTLESSTRYCSTSRIELGGLKFHCWAHNLSKRAFFIPRPSQDELLGARCFDFLEDGGDARESLWLIED